jgi:anti-sigma B factor antagonist
MTVIHHSPPDRELASVATHVVGRRSVLALSGEIDVATAPALSAAIDAALAGGATELWIDLTGTSFLDSSGVHALYDGHREASALNRRLLVICPSGMARRVLELVGAIDHLPVFRDRAAAHRAG